MRGAKWTSNGSAASVAMYRSSMPPLATISRSVLPVSVCMEERKAAGGRVAREVDGDDHRDAQRHREDGEGRAQQVAAQRAQDEGAEELHIAVDRRLDALNAAVAQVDTHVGDGGGFGAVGGHQDGGAEASWRPRGAGRAPGRRWRCRGCRWVRRPSAGRANGPGRGRWRRAAFVRRKAGTACWRPSLRGPPSAAVRARPRRYGRRPPAAAAVRYSPAR